MALQSRWGSVQSIHARAGRDGSNGSDGCSSMQVGRTGQSATVRASRRQVPRGDDKGRGSWCAKLGKGESDCEVDCGVVEV